MTSKSPPPSTAFKPGQSGNPAGKPAGTRNKATRPILSLTEDNAKEITEAVIEAAKDGDLSAAKIGIERNIHNTDEIACSNTTGRRMRRQHQPPCANRS